MATPTYTALATLTATGSESSITFSSIPTSGYRDLVLVTDGTFSTDSGDRFIRVNGATTNYSSVLMTGDGSGTASNSYTLAGMLGLAAFTAAANTVIQLMDYSATDKHKTVLVRQNAPGSVVRAVANRWASTSAINEVALVPSTGTFNSGFTASLYGIEA